MRRRSTWFAVPGSDSDQFGPEIVDVEMHVGVARRGHRPMSQHLRHDLDRDAAADQFSCSAVTQCVWGELDPGPGPEPADQLGDTVIAQRPPDRRRPEVHEHIVGVHGPVFAVHVVAVEADQRRRHRQRDRTLRLGSRPVGVVGSGHDRDLASPAHEIGVPQPERLANSHPGLGQQREQETVPRPITRRQNHHDLLSRDRLR